MCIDLSSIAELDMNTLRSGFIAMKDDLVGLLLGRNLCGATGREPWLVFSPLSSYHNRSAPRSPAENVSKTAIKTA